jgi:hypothetical protein
MSRITLANGDFSASSDYSLPVADGAQYFNFFNGGIENLSRNLVGIGAPRASIIGAPAVNTGYASLVNQVNYIDTPVLDQEFFTYLAVVRVNSNAIIAHIVSTYAGGSGLDRGDGIFFTPGPARTLQSTVTLNNSGTQMTVQSSAGANLANIWSFVVQRVSATQQTLNCLTTASVDADPITSPIAIIAGRKVRLGSSYQVAASGCDMAFAAIYNRALDDAELSLIYTRVKATVALTGIVI